MIEIEFYLPKNFRTGSDAAIVDLIVPSPTSSLTKVERRAPRSIWRTIARSGRARLRLSQRPRQQGPQSCIHHCLCVWLIDLGNGFFVESAATHVGNNPDYRKPVIFLTTCVLAFEALSDRIFAGPVPTGHTLIDDCDKRRMWTVLRRKIAAS